MRNTIIILIISLIAVSCGKDKFTTAPQIKFKSIKPDRVPSNVIIHSADVPLLTIGVTDREGDLGFVDGKDTAFLFIRNIALNRTDSFHLPDIQSAAGKNFDSDILMDMFDVLRPDPRYTNRPRVDTLMFELYVKDFAKNKSNVITAGPLYYEVQ
ncbi:MAG: hypothetical protein ABIN67_14770 [Ferruginibacter sp.]